MHFSLADTFCRKLWQDDFSRGCTEKCCSGGGSWSTRGTFLWCSEEICHGSVQKEQFWGLLVFSITGGSPFGFRGGPRVARHRPTEGRQSCAVSPRLQCQSCPFHSVFGVSLLADVPLWKFLICSLVLIMNKKNGLKSSMLSFVTHSFTVMYVV